MKKYIYFLLALFAINSVAYSQQAEIDKPAPKFALPDSFDNTVNLTDYYGKWIVLEWINFDCPFVKKHYNSHNMQKLQKEYEKRGVVWLSVCSSAPGKQGNFTSDEINKKILALRAAPTAYLVDKDGKIGKMYGAKTTPHMFIIDPKGILIYAGAIDDIKSTDEADVEKAKNYVKTVLDAVLSGYETTIKTTTPYGCSVKY